MNNNKEMFLNYLTELVSFYTNDNNVRKIMIETKMIEYETHQAFDTIDGFDYAIGDLITDPKLRKKKNPCLTPYQIESKKGRTPDIYGNVVVTDKANKMAEFELTVLNRSDDHDLLEKYYQERINFTFSYIDNRKTGSSVGGSGTTARILKAAGQGLEDDPTYTITVLDYQAK